MLSEKSKGENVKIEATMVRENKDGSGVVTLDFDKEGLQFLVQEGFIAIIKDYLKQNENAKKGIEMRKRAEARKARASATAIKGKPKNNKRSSKVSTRS